MSQQHLRDLSVVIPTYQRPIYALRNMHLLDQTGARIHVLDGSPTPIDPARLSRLSSRVNYVHLPRSYEERMAHAVDLVETPYCVSLSDDDQHLPSGLAAALDALRANPELVAAVGTALYLRHHEGRVTGTMIYAGLHGRRIDSDDPVQRMVDHLGAYLPSTVYAVTRTPTWQRAMRAVTDKRFVPVRIGELQYELTVAYAGKSAVVPQLMWLRSLENRPHWATDDVPLAPWWAQAADSGERDEFAEYMGRALTDDVDAQAAAGRGALLAVDTYMQALAESTALRESLTPSERAERFPAPPELPLTEWGRKVAGQGVAVDAADLAAAIAAVEATPEKLPKQIPRAWIPAGETSHLRRLINRLGRRLQGSGG